MSKQITKAITNSIINAVTDKISNTINNKMQKSNKKKKTTKKKKGSSNTKSAPVATATGFRNTNPQFIGRNSTSCRIRHTEYVGSVSGRADWTDQGNYDINPGNADTFPWLSSQAISWEKYRFLNLTFHYRTRCSTSVGGTVALIPVYDPSDSFPPDEADAASFTNYRDDAPWKDITCPVDRSQLANYRFTRTQRKELPSHTSINDFDIGKLFVGTSGATVDQLWGRIYVTYDVEFIQPQKGTLAEDDNICYDAIPVTNNYLFGQDNITNRFTNVTIQPTSQKLTFYGTDPSKEYFLYFNGTGVSPTTGVTYLYATVSRNIFSGATNSSVNYCSLITPQAATWSITLTAAGTWSSSTIFIGTSNRVLSLSIEPSADFGKSELPNSYNDDESSSSSTSPVLVHRQPNLGNDFRPHGSRRTVQIHNSKGVDY